MQTATILAIASSVSMAQGFDALDAMTYALEGQFQGFQVYLNQQLIADAKLRENIRARCEQHHLALLAHAPATLIWPTITQEPLALAVKTLFASESQARVVHHYDETLGVEESLWCLRFLSAQGITTCLENYFMRGAETSLRCFREYLLLLRRANALGIACIPVFDIPRLYDSRLGLVPQAMPLIEEALGVFQELETPLILHLIDTKNDAGIRSSWCPIGQGIIPYRAIFEQITARKIPLHMVVLEYEDKDNPRLSKPFLEEQLGNPL